MKIKYPVLLFLLFVLWVYLCARLIYTLISPPVAYIYVDPASSSSLFHMMDIVTQDPSNPKYVAWRRYSSSFPRKLIAPLNVTLSSVKPSMSNSHFSQLISKEIASFYHRYPGYVFVIHANIEHPWFVESILSVIPPDRVKHIYLYEDSIGRTLWEGLTSKFFSFFGKYPITYRIGYTDRFLKSFPRWKQFVQNVSIMDFKKLSDKQKGYLYALAGLDKDKLSSFFNDRPVGIFFDDCNLQVDQVAPFFEKRIVENPKLKKINWLYKNHPRCAIEGPFWEKLKHYFPDVQLLPNKMPWEILLMAGLTPDYVCGYGSSVFFSARSEQVLCYIERPGDKYLPVLKQLGFVSDESVILQEEMKSYNP